MIAKKGWLGVDLFFILSGFIISYVHHKDFTTHISDHNFKQFMIRRIARIYPVHLLTTLALIPIFLIAKWVFNYSSGVNAFSIEKLIYSLTLTNGFGFSDSLGWNTPSWSISSEFLAYTAFPFLAILLLRKQFSAIKCLALITTIFFITTVIGWTITDQQSYIAGWGWTPVRVLSEFMFGMLLFQLYRLNLAAPNSLLAIMATSIIIAMSIINSDSRWDFLMILSFGLLIYALTDPNHLLSKFLGSNKMRYLGKISYSIYLCHGVVFMVLNNVLPKLLPHISILLASCVYVVTTLIIAHLTYYFVEVPAQSWLKTLLKNKILPRKL